MTSRIKGNRLVLAVILALAGCAGTPPEKADAPVSNTVPFTAPPAAADQAAAAPKKPEATSAGFRLVTRNGQEVYCRREQMTGSLTRVSETCLTKPQMEARLQSDQALLQDLQNAPNVTQSTAPPP